MQRELELMPGYPNPLCGAIGPGSPFLYMRRLFQTSPAAVRPVCACPHTPKTGQGAAR